MCYPVDMEELKRIIREEIGAVRDNTDALRALLAGQVEVINNLVKGHADHESRLRKLEYFIAAAVGAVGLFKLYMIHY